MKKPIAYFAILLAFGAPLYSNTLYAQGSGSDEVLVELDVFSEDSSTGKIRLLPYADRRLPWGLKFGIFFRRFAPVNYNSVHDQTNYVDLYTEEPIDLIEFQASIQKNMRIGSIALEFALGSAGIANAEEERQLSVSTIKLSSSLYLNTLFSEPYIVPYGRIGGMGLTYYDQLPEEDTQTAMLSPSIFFAGGLLIQLDWLDPDASRKSYLAYGLENTYLALEVTKYLRSTDESEPDFSTSPEIGLGVVMEF